MAGHPRSLLLKWQTQTETFLAQVGSFLREQSSGVSEYQILKCWREKPLEWLPPYALNDHLALFQTHFWLFHLLYQLRDTLWQQHQEHLTISPLRIEIEIVPLPSTSAEESCSEYTINHPASYDSLRTFYLDLKHLAVTTETEVAALMGGGLLRLQAASRSDTALSALGLSSDTSWHEIRSRYRQLVQKHHPDRGGNISDFRRIQSAMEILQQCHFGSNRIDSNG